MYWVWNLIIISVNSQESLEITDRTERSLDLELDVGLHQALHWMGD